MRDAGISLNVTRAATPKRTRNALDDHARADRRVVAA
jgi:hypothetical protein